MDLNVDLQPRQGLPTDLQTITIFRALQLGDWLCAIPAVRALRKAYPAARITLLGLPWSIALLTRFPHYFDEFIHFPGFPGLPEQPFDPGKTLPFMTALYLRKMDLLLQMQGNGNITNPLLMLCGPKYYAGFYRGDNFQPNSDYFFTYPDEGSEIHRHLKLMEFLGIPPQGDDLEFPLYATDYREHAALALPVADGAYVIIHPGARAEARQWSAQHFAQLGDWSVQAGYPVILTGVESERHLTNAVRMAMHGPVLDLTGRTTLGALGVLVQKARLVICNDTGISHVAAALKTPSVVISLAPHSPEDEKVHPRWAPLNQQLHRYVHAAQPDALSTVLAAVQDQLHEPP